MPNWKISVQDSVPYIGVLCFVNDLPELGGWGLAPLSSNVFAVCAPAKQIGSKPIRAEPRTGVL